MNDAIPMRTTMLAVVLFSIVGNAAPVGGQSPGGPVARRDWSDPFKRVVLGEDGNVWIGFDGSLRERFETWNGFNFGFNPAAKDASFLLTRAMASGDLHLGDDFRVFLQYKSSMVTDRTLGRPIDVDQLAVQQGYAEARLPGSEGKALTVRLGRMEMTPGRERLVSSLDWANVRQTFDGGSVAASAPDRSLTAFWVRPVIVKPYTSNVRDSATVFYGAYGTRRFASANVGLDAYWMGLQRRAATFNGTTGPEDRQTFGGRAWGPVRPGSSRFDYDLEAALQTGTLGTNDISAHMVAGQAGYTFAGVQGAPRVYAGIDYASGDEMAGGDVQTYNLLFANPHAYLGYEDVIGRPNALDLSVGTAMRVWRDLVGQLDLHNYSRVSAGDKIYNKLGGVIPGRTGTLSTLPKAVGAEFDLTMRYPVIRHALLTGGYTALLLTL